MSSNLLFEQVTILQEEYKELLKKLLPILRKGFSFAVLDEIKLFWTKKINLVELFLKVEVANNNSYIFTGAACMDYEAKDHYPFLLLGKCHVFDDPLARYADVCIKAPETQLADNLFKQIVKGTENNISLLEACKDVIFILPLSLFNYDLQENEHLFSTGTDYFLSLFDGIHDIDDYYNKCNSIADIESYLQEHVQHFLLFTKHDDFNISFSERYNNAINELDHLLGELPSDAHKFYGMIFGNITRSIDILSICLLYQSTPMIRFTITFYYFIFLCTKIDDFSLSAELRLKTTISYIIYHKCDRTLLSSKGFKFFMDKIIDYSFESKVMEEIHQSGITLTQENYSLKKISPVVKSCLDELYLVFDK